jgi:hypothetical protein
MINIANFNETGLAEEGALAVVLQKTVLKPLILDMINPELLMVDFRKRGNYA